MDTNGEPNRGGRPRIGRSPGPLRLPEPLIAELDTVAAEREISRAEAVRRLLGAGLAAYAVLRRHEGSDAS